MEEIGFLSIIGVVEGGREELLNDLCLGLLSSTTIVSTVSQSRVVTSAMSVYVRLGAPRRSLKYCTFFLHTKR